MPRPADLSRALRSLARRRGFAATVVLTLSLACSLPAVVLSALDRHFWRPLDLVDSERLFTLQILIEDGGFSPLSHPEYAQLRDTGAEVFSLATFGRFDFTLVAGGAPTRVNVALASGNSSRCWEHGRRTAACCPCRTTARTARQRRWSFPTVPGRLASVRIPGWLDDPYAWAVNRSPSSASR